MNSLYLLLIAIVVLFSWLGSAYALPLPDGGVLPNLLSGEGMRWLVRHSVDNIAAAPLVEVLLVLISAGALHSSGLFDAMIHRERHTVRRDRHALRIALVVLVICACVVLVSIAPGGNLLGVTGHIAGGPFSTGWLFLLTLVVTLPSIVYGWMNGNWHGEREVFAGLSSKIASYAGYFVTLVLASQLVAIVQYVRLFDLCGVSYTVQRVFVACIYCVPLIFSFITKNFIHDTSSIE